MPSIDYNGRPYNVQPGDTVASALFRGGVRVFSRSFKYHRPRGLLCGSGHCPNCLMNVDGIPNVRTCVTPVRDGMRVRHQNAFPSPEFDVLAVTQLFGRLMPVGFYYKTFTHPLVWKAVEPFIRRVAGLGVVPRSENGQWNMEHGESKSILHAPSSHLPAYEHDYAHTDVAVIGGGPAGLAAAEEAARGGADVTLVDEGSELGGHLLDMRAVENGPWASGDAQAARNGASGTLTGANVARAFAATLDANPRVRVIRNATCFGFYESRLLGIVQRGDASVRERLLHLRARRVVIATGGFEVPIVFENNDLPGIMLSGAARRLANRHGIRPGETAVIVSSEPSGGTIAEDLRAAGVKIAAVVSPGEVVAAKGRKRVVGVATTTRWIGCDLVVVCGPRVPDAGLVGQAGGRLRWDARAGAFLPAGLPPQVFAAGHVTGATSLREAAEQGRAAGAAAARGQPEEWKMDDGQSKDENGSMARDAGSSTSAVHSPSSIVHPPSSCPGRSFVCLCEDVTEKDLCHAVAEGFDRMETLKRYSTVTMGPCQGRMCQLASVGICARETGRTVAETGLTTARPPARPVSLGALAGAAHHPVKRTPLHAKHDEIGCVWMDMGEWKRPLYYVDKGSRTMENGAPGHGGSRPLSIVHSPAFKRACIEREYRAVREAVGIIDLSTLGKLEVQGADAPKLLDKVYTHRFSDLRAGRVRYGVVCDDAGIILDDGTVSRLADDHYFITTTTGNIEFAQQWLEWWAIGTGWCVHVTNVTGGYAAVNVAGPKAREALAPLTACDLSAKAFPYMACARADVAGIPCFLMRIGFVGETGWEIHYPAEHGEFLWDALIEAGRPHGLRPFGVEAQRLLRLEKKHVIVGVDTDATSGPLASDMAWVAKMDKDDFIGKAAIRRAQARGVREKLVGFVMQDGAVPEDGAAVAQDGRPVGRVTSVRFSPLNGRAVGLAWVPSELAAEGREMLVHVHGTFAKARITLAAFYDPEGKRLKS